MNRLSVVCTSDVPHWIPPLAFVVWDGTFTPRPLTSPVKVDPALIARPAAVRVGDIVLYTLAGCNRGQVRPALVTRINPRGTLDLTIFRATDNDGDDAAVWQRPCLPQVLIPRGKAGDPGTWHPRSDS